MVATILDFVTTRHGHKPIYGWLIFLILIGGVFAAIAAASARERVLRTRKSAQAEVTRTDLGAEVITRNPARRVSARLRQLDSHLELALADSSKSGEVAEVKLFTTLMEVETYLEANTILRIGDFRPSSL